MVEGSLRRFFASASLALIVAPMAPLAHAGGYLGDGHVGSGENESAELARAVQNPIADLISLPFQNNTNFDFGPREKTQNVLNIQPVIPFSLGEDWLAITRTIVPIVSQPSLRPGQDRETGLDGSVRRRVWACVSTGPTPPDEYIGPVAAGGGLSRHRHPVGLQCSSTGPCRVDFVARVRGTSDRRDSSLGETYGHNPGHR